MVRWTSKKIRNCGLCSGLGGLIFLGLAIFLAPFIQSMVRSGILDQVVISRKAKDDNSAPYQQFVDNNDADTGHASTTIKVFFWNVTNPDAVVVGAKPIVEEIGPYVYDSCEKKLNVTFTEDYAQRKLVRYYPYTYYTFRPDLSFKGADPIQDVIVNVDIILQTVYALTEELHALEALELLYRNQTDVERLFLEASPADWLFGYKDSVTGVEFPGLNANMTTLEEVWANGATSLYTGEQYHDLLGQYYEYNGRTQSVCAKDILLPNKLTPCWGNDEANRIWGTTGDNFAPLNTIDTSSTVSTYVSALPRMIPLQATGNTKKTNGIKLVQVVVTNQTMLTTANRPQNEAYGNTDFNGFWNLTVSNGGAPVFISMAHFLYVDEEIRNLVEGVSDAELLKHTTELDVEPNTGIVMDGYQRWQVNVRLSPMGSNHTFPPFSWFPKVDSRLHMPICWLEYGGAITPKLASEFRSGVYGGGIAAAVIKWAGFSLGVILVCVCVFLLIKANKVKEEDRGTGINDSLLDVAAE